MRFSCNAPLGSDIVPKVPLPAAPLASVIAQIRFPEIAAIARDDFVAPFQEAIRSRYPNATKEPQFLLVAEVGNDIQRSSAGFIWKFRDTSGAWNLSLASGFVALETKAYESREDFVHRLDAILQALEMHIRPLTYIRLGVRYIDRVDREEDLNDLDRLIRPELLPLRSLMNGATHGKLTQTFAQAELEHRDAILRVRSACLPPMYLIDNVSLEPVDRQSWVLDLDMFEFHAAPVPFAAKGVSERARLFAETIYRVFRWSITDEFLARMGGVA